MISSAELAQMRNSITSSLTDRATVKQRTLTADGFGNEAASYSAVRTIRCRIRSANNGRPRSGKPVTADKAAQQQTFIVTVPHDTSLNDTDRLTIRSVEYEIVSDASSELSLFTCKRLVVKKVTS